MLVHFRDSLENLHRAELAIAEDGAPRIFWSRPFVPVGRGTGTL